MKTNQLTHCANIFNPSKSTLCGPVLTAIFGLLCLTAQAAVQNLPFYDNFNYPTGSKWSAITTNTIWLTADTGSANQYIGNAGLISPANFSPGSALSAVEAYSSPCRNIGMQFNPVTASSGDGTAVFLSFLYSIKTYPGATSLIDYLDFRAPTKDLATNTIAGPIILDSTGHIGINQGCNTNTAGGAGPQIETTALGLGSTHLIVAKYTFHPASHDTMELWVDPTNTSYGAAAPPAGDGLNPTSHLTVTALGTGSTTNYPSLAYFTMGCFSSTYVGTNDEVRIATSWAGVTPPVVSASVSTVTVSPTTVAADGSTPATITVALTNSASVAVSGKTVTLAQTSGTGATISAASGTSDASGHVTFTVTDTTVENTGFTATDTSDSLVISQTAAVSFTAAGNAPPSVTTQTASLVNVTAATLNGTVGTNAGSALTDYGFYWSTTTPVSTNSTKLQVGTADLGAYPGTYTVSLGSLNPNTIYYYRAYAANALGLALGNADVSFYTLAATPAAPVVGTPTATSLPVTLGADGNPAITRYAIKETGTGKFIQAGGTLGSAVIYQTAAAWGTVTVGGLTPGVTYTFAAEATNAIGVNTGFGPTTSGTTVSVSPFVTTQGATGTGTAAATLNGTITYNGGAAVTDYGFYWSTTSPVTTGSPQAQVGTTDYSGTFNLSSLVLSPNTKYYFSAYAANSVGTTLGSQTNFYTLANTPTASIVGGPGANSLTVQIGGGDGNPASTLYAIQQTNLLGTNYVQLNGTLGAAAVYQTSNGWATVTVTNLSGSTTYNFQVVATNGAGIATVFGPVASGTTLSGAPSVATLAANPTNTTSTTLNGTVLANGGVALTDYGFYWGTTPGITTSNTKIQVGASDLGAYPGTYNSSLGSLSPNTIYYYRAYAGNASGIVLDTADTIFYTLANTPTTPTVNGGTVNSLNVTLGVGDGNPAGTLYAIYDATTAKYVTATGGLTSATPVYQSATTWGTVTVTNLSSCTTYNFEVAAENGAGMATAFSASATGSLLAPATPVVPGTVTTTTTSFTATWTASTGATGYYLDVAYDSLFTSLVSGYSNLSVGNVTTKSVTPGSGGTFYYRVRAASCAGTSTNSTTVTVTGVTGQTIAQLPFYDSFNYGPTNGILTKLGGNTWLQGSTGSSLITYATNGLTAPSGFAPATNGAATAKTSSNPRDIGTQYATQSAVEGASVCFSFLYQLNAAPIFNSSIAFFNDTAPVNNENAISGTAGAILINSSLQVGIDQGGGSSANGTLAFGSTVLTLNATNLIVARYTFHPSTHDTLELWVNPASGSYGAGSAPTADVTVTASGTGSSVNKPSLAYFTLCNEGTNSLGTVGTIASTWDELRIGTNWASVTPGIIPFVNTNQFLTAYDAGQGFFSGENLMLTNRSGAGLSVWSSSDPTVSVTNWTLEGAMAEQVYNDHSGNSLYSINVTPATSPVYYIFAQSNAGSYFATEPLNRLTTSDFVSFTLASSNQVINASGVFQFPGLNSFPTVQVTSPTNAAILNAGSSPVISADAQELGGTITNVEFFANATDLGGATTAPYSLTWPNVVVGSFALTAVATDALGLMATSSVVNVTVVVGHVPPTVSLTSPANYTTFNAPASVSLSATAAANTGNVTNVAFYQGSTLLTNVTSAPYNFTWANVTAGAYALTAMATDDSGASTTSGVVNITVISTNALASQFIDKNVGIIFMIGMENHNFTQPSPTSSPQQISNNPACPYLNSLITPGNSNATYVSFAKKYYNAGAGVHPSEPSYIWEEAGTDFGFHADTDPSAGVGNLFNVMHFTKQLDVAGISWSNFEEDVEYTTPTVSKSGSGSRVNAYNGTTQYYYAVKHNPMAFFTDSQTKNVYSLTNFAAALANNTLGKYNWVMPNIYNCMHSALSGGFTYQGISYTGDQAAIAQGDNFLSIIIPQIMASPAFANNGVIIIRFDESEGGDSTSYTIPEIIISPLAKGNAYASSVVMSHSSDVKTMEEIFGLNYNNPAGANYMSNAIPASETASTPSGTYNNVATVNDLSDLFLVGPVITNQPVSQSVLAGKNVSFNVGATGSNLGYEWFFNSNGISGATTSVLGLTNVQTANAGPYVVIVTNSAGAATSSVASLVVAAPPLVTASVGTPGQLQLSGTTITGLTYIVQASTNLGSSAWVPVFTNNTGNSGTLNFQPSGSGEPMLFYRLVFP